MMQMSDATFDLIADQLLSSLDRTISQFDPDDLEADLSGGVLTITVRRNNKFVLNKQRPTRQIWMAALRRAWHFNFDEATQRWHSDKGGDEVLFLLEGLLARELGRSIDLGSGWVPPVV